MPVSHPFRLWLWLLIMVGLSLMAYGVTRHWIRQADQSRAALRQSMGEIERADRRELTRQWGERVSWTPSPQAPVSLAVMPRTKRMHFDAIYALYEGERVTAVLALTSIGGYFNGSPFNNRKYPQTLIARRLTAGELRNLQTMIGLLEQRLKTLNPQSDRYGWTQEVLRIARTLEQAQSSQGAPGEKVASS